MLYAVFSMTLLAQIILSFSRPHQRSLTFMSWTPALLPFVDFEKTALNLENIHPKYYASMSHERDNSSALSKPIRGYQITP